MAAAVRGRWRICGLVAGPVFAASGDPTPREPCPVGMTGAERGVPGDGGSLNDLPIAPPAPDAPGVDRAALRAVVGDAAGRFRDVRLGVAWAE